ncbi:protein-disulfide reductase DsbD domain-containing protein [Seonamhaeicola aphaedonensis]|uniref:Disulfide bond corrector protein DsbC n=1 Tax=Seonamhaeicola aphaedonensis TaxID=1461338 RepID=A0A3D9HEI7_9FLAO|nr:protein-disulfide reductase DsbD domain-containing protein [Seonamhaeicola aphaedonensis]RED47894.1 disulfide bond corrector protein DsbC [Seonamhaeicola aphaedonensis]
MKKLPFLFLFISLSGFSQMLEPVKWTTSIEKNLNKQYDIVFTATIQEGWHLYSQHLEEGGPLPTIFKFEPNNNYQCIGKPTEQEPIEVFEEVFEMNVKYFEKKTVFKQRIKIKHNTPFKVKGEITYMSCNKHQCLPGQFNFEIEIP